MFLSLQASLNIQSHGNTTSKQENHIVFPHEIPESTIGIILTQISVWKRILYSIGWTCSKQRGSWGMFSCKSENQKTKWKKSESEHGKMEDENKQSENQKWN